jgi:hypothetical protein
MDASKVLQRFRISLGMFQSLTLFFSIYGIHQTQSNSKLTDFKVALALSGIDWEKWIIYRTSGTDAECVL